MYTAAILGTPDFSSPGVAWDAISLIIYTTGFRMGLPFGDGMDDVTLVLTLRAFATLHYLLDMFQIPMLLMRKEVKHRLEPVVYALITGVVYFFVKQAIPNAWALGSVGLGAGLIAEITEEVSKALDPANMPTGIRVVADFVKTNKTDGVLLTVMVITILALFGIK